MFSQVLQKLQPFAQEFSRHGKKLYLVGGAVRNLLLGRPVQDFDFTTDALPTEVQGYFKKVLPTGLQHGTVTVIFHGDSYEVTTFRVDGGYSDGRRPDQVTFTPSLEEDLKRRDFTINAIALDLSDGQLIDPHDGKVDLERGILRAIGDPGKRFDEDALRLLRLFRFTSQLGFEIDGTTLAAVPERRSSLSAVSKERIREELLKTMAGARPDLAWSFLSELGFLSDIFQPLDPARLSPRSLDHLTKLNPALRWSLWLTLSCPDTVSQWERTLKGLTFSNQDVASILGPAKALGFLSPGDNVTVTAKALIEAWGNRDRIELGSTFLEALETEGIWKDSSGFCRELRRLKDSGEPIFIGELALGGSEILAAGIGPGPRVGQVLKALQAVVWADPGLNSSEELLRRSQALR